VPHRLTKDDFYEGYFIPKGALVHGNQWAVNRDEAIYPDPETFDPGRWLEPSYPTYKEPLGQFPNLKRDTAFGWGRRICPGLETAERSLGITVATIVWACNIVKKKDASGRELEIIPYDMEEDSLMFPRDFPFTLQTRYEARMQLLRDDIAKSTITGYTDTLHVYE
jgi:cytochrome P450